MAENMLSVSTPLHVERSKLCKLWQDVFLILEKKKKKKKK